MDAENPRAVMGANQPPDPLVVEANERIDNASKWLTERPDWKAWDLEMADKANFFIGQIGGTFTALDNQRKAENREWLAKQDEKYKAPLAMLEKARERLVPLRREWLKREDDKVQEARRKAEAIAEAARLAAAEAERKAQEAESKKGGDPIRASYEADQAHRVAEEAAAAVEAAPTRATIKGQYTSIATGLREYWSGEITDLSEAFKHFNKTSNPYKTVITAAITAAIQSIADKEAKLHKDKTKAPPGITFLMEKR